jgi:hypothetical protein
LDFQENVIKLGCWWLTLVVLAIWEAKIKRIAVQELLAPK